MEMSESGTNTLAVGDVKDVSEKSKSMRPAVIGVPNSHGVKFPANISSQSKKDLLSKLEEWRKARKEKLAATILAKQKQVLPSASIKNQPIRPALTRNDVGFKRQPDSPDRQSVFERLYKNNGKMKKPELPAGCSKPQKTPNLESKKSNFFHSEGSVNQNEKVLLTEKRIEHETHSPEEVFQSCQIGSLNDGGIAPGKKRDGNDPDTVVQGNNCVTITKSAPPLDCNQMKSTNLSMGKADSALKNLPGRALETGKHKNTLRRSISMKFRQKSRSENIVRRCVSVKHLNEININSELGSLHRAGGENLKHLQDHREKGAKNEVKSVALATPKNTKSFTASHLRGKLEDWLKLNGHPLEGYRHLRCFGVINKAETFKPVAAPADIPCEKSHVSTPNQSDIQADKENVVPATHNQQVDKKEAENWLKELHRLIVELKYPPERCEEWLIAIKKKCVGCTQLPIYWECLAALHESKGDLKSAIEDYETAIIKGGEVDSVGDSLAQLFDKMVIEQNKHSKPKLEKGLDPKNIFKSTIIKFALQQKAIKKLSSEIEPGVREQLYIATPVRRSSRIQTPCKSTDEVASLRSLTPELRKNVTFKPNESLLQ